MSKMRFVSKLAFGLAACLAAAALTNAGEIRLLRAVSGPSGKVDGSQFIFDQTRSRFVHPQDSFFVVYFEWEAPLGTHALTAYWKRPDGQVASISPDAKIESKSKLLACYWTYLLDPAMMPGVWSVEVRIDGQPAGSHPFEIAGTASPQPPPATPPAPKLPTLDQIFRAVSPALVWVRRFDATGRHPEAALGFVLEKDRVATALQAVDGATRLEVEFVGGRRVETDELLAASRAGDWAILAVDTGATPGLGLGDAAAVTIGERLVLFTVEGGAKVIGGVDISGKRTVPGFGERIQFSPGIPSAAAGGPLLDLNGKVVGIVGGSVTPGANSDVSHTAVNQALGILPGGVSAVTPIAALQRPVSAKTAKLSDLLAAGVLSAPLSDSDGLVSVQTFLDIPKNATEELPREVTQFSRRDQHIWVVSMWMKRGKVYKGALSAKVYDDQNRVRLAVEPKKMSLIQVPIRSSFSFSPAPLDTGVYRIDLIWDDQPVWRTFIRISD